jgi:hypothetical protein
VPTAETAARTLLLEAGWWLVHHYFRMQIALMHAPAAPDVLTRTFDPEHDREAVWHLVLHDGKGIVGAALGEHGEQETGVVRAAAAARLFESVGMTAVAQSERWEKVVGA